MMRMKFSVLNLSYHNNQRQYQFVESGSPVAEALTTVKLQKRRYAQRRLCTARCFTSLLHVQQEARCRAALQNRQMTAEGGSRFEKLIAREKVLKAETRG